MDRKFFVSILATFILLLALFGFLLKSSGNNEKRMSNNNSTAIAVVELFTSEGCSSCPPADQLLGELKKENDAQVFLLAFHVDYWNYLGWKDRFSDAQYSKRQNEYASVLHSGVYTPQMIVNGSKVFVGSDQSKAKDAITSAINKTTINQIKFESQFDDAKRFISLKFSVEGDTKDEVLNVALIENEVTNNISRGENSGRILHHVNVVRSFKIVSLNKADGELIMEIPADVSVKNASLILYSQKSTSKEITSAAISSILSGDR